MISDLIRQNDSLSDRATCVLDLACGSGRFTIPLAKVGIEFVGLDFSSATGGTRDMVLVGARSTRLPGHSAPFMPGVSTEAAPFGGTRRIAISPTLRRL
jgi:hypothetical protein